MTDCTLHALLPKTGLLRRLAMFTLALLWAHPASSGELVISNLSQNTIVCTVDGYTIATGWKFDWQIQVQPGVPFYVAPNYNRNEPVINWADCGGLKTRQMTITPRGPNGFVVLNGTQKRVLNAALYPYLPSNPNGNFDALVKHVIASYQAKFPDVLLNGVLNPDLPIYDYQGLAGLLGADGFDVMEVDMLYAGFMASSGLILPARLPAANYQPTGIAAASYQGTQYGVPSWLCMDFIYSYDPALKGVSSLSELLAFFKSQPGTRPQMVGIFNGSWRLPAIYINTFVQTYGYGAVGKALQMPPDPTAIKALALLTSSCAFDGANNCVNNVYHGGADGVTEKVFAQGNASSDVGFSEQSFYIKLYENSAQQLTTVATPWGETPQPLLYTDAFVTSAANCASNDCRTDADNLAALMTGDDMKTYIAFAQDLPVGTPPRRLLVATKSFYQQQQVQDDPLYQQYQTVLPASQPFPNSITAAQQGDVAGQVCAALQTLMPGYVCKKPTSMLRREYRR